MNLFIKQKQAYRFRERIYGCQWGRMGGERIAREFGMDVHTLLYLKRITNKDPLYSSGNSAPCSVAAWMGRESGGEWIHVCMAETLCCPPETITYC